MKLILLKFQHQVYYKNKLKKKNRFILANEKWLFQLYDHVYSDQTEMKAEINATKTQTVIELRLYKQQIHTTWPQLYNRQYTPITPQQQNSNIDMIDQQEPPYELSIKKVQTNFTEPAANKATLHILIKQVFDCQVQFTDTNFTAIFYSKFEHFNQMNFYLIFFYSDEDFLQTHSISSKTPIKLFARVKERIKPDQCTYTVTATYIDIAIAKDYQYGLRWNRLEPNEYSESRPLIPTSPLSSHPLSITNTNSVMNNINRGEI